MANPAWHAGCDSGAAVNNAFAPMSQHQRRSFASHYMSYLRERDGEPCLETRTLSRREALLVRMGSAARTASVRVDVAAFRRNLDRRTPEAGLDPATLWALAVAKGNRAERYGVEHKLATRGFESSGRDDILTYVELQECYHTRLLLDVLGAVGLDCDVGPPVGGLTRAGVRLFSQLPRPLLDVLALAFEVVGIAAFRAMRDEARELFADEPDLVRRVDDRFAQLLVDEVGHVQFLRSRLGRARLTLARVLLPFAKRALFDDNDEIRTLLERRRALEGIVDLDLDAVVAGDPERLPAFEG